MKKIIKEVLFGKVVETNYTPIKSGWKTIKTEPISFNEWAKNINNQIRRNYEKTNT